MSGINHQHVRIVTPAGQIAECLIKNPQLAPSDKAIVELLVGTIIRWSITPAKAIADHEHHPGYNPAIIHSGYPVSQGNLEN